MKGADKIEKIVYFVRHGQSDDNIAPVFQSPDSPLSAKGRDQAASIAGRISKIDFDLLVSSPFQRAKETAEMISGKTSKKIEFSDLFVERIKPTYINGKSFEDSAANSLWKEWERSLYSSGLRAADGENYDDITDRADKALDFLKARNEKSIVAVTHGFFLRTILSRVLLGDLLTPELFLNIQKMAAMENTGITVLRYYGTYDSTPCWRLWIYNDHAHLG